jgi:hypothetical protein
MDIHRGSLQPLEEAKDEPAILTTLAMLREKYHPHV